MSEPVPAPTTSDPGGWAKSAAISNAPLLLALASFIIFCNVVLLQSPKMIEPDAYAYRASIYALVKGDVMLTRPEYDRLSVTLLGTPSGGGIMQWRADARGEWISEKNPGYPFLVVGFKKFGALRMAPLFFGALGCIGLWLGARKWLGAWGAGYAVSLFCSSSAAMLFAWRETMPTFTDTSLLACGIGLLIWTVLSIESRMATRLVTGGISFLVFGLATFVRYTNLTTLIAAAVIALVACFRGRWRLPRWAPLLWGAIVMLPVGGILLFNERYYGSPVSTGYASGAVGFALSSVATNIREQPGRLATAMPVYLVALGAVGMMAWNQFRRTPAVDPTKTDMDMQPSFFRWTPETVDVDRVVGAFLALAWLSLWGLYLTYEWTSRYFDYAALNGIGDYTFTRLFVPALAPIALLAAWLLVRVPRAGGLLMVGALYCYGIYDFVTVANGVWANTDWYQVDIPASTIPPASAIPGVS